MSSVVRIQYILLLNILYAWGLTNFLASSIHNSLIRWLPMTSLVNKGFPSPEHSIIFTTSKLTYKIENDDNRLMHQIYCHTFDLTLYELYI